MLKGFSKGGVHPPGFKISRAEAIVELPPPTVAVIPLSQHIGAPAVPCVAKGDRVVTGQLIAAADGFVSANVESLTCVGKVAPPMPTIPAFLMRVMISSRVR